MLFRFQRGGLKESMDTQVEVFSLSELRNIIETSKEVEITGDLEFRYLCYDERIGWDTYYVLGDTGYGKHVIGMSNDDKFMSLLEILEEHKKKMHSDCAKFILGVQE